MKYESRDDVVGSLTLMVDASKIPPASTAYVFLALSLALIATIRIQKTQTSSSSNKKPHALPKNPQKRAYETFVLKYSALWMAIFTAVVASGVYEAFGAREYNALCAALALPLLLSPWLAEPASSGRRRPLPLARRHSTRAQLWIALFSFIGNYWYTHYFYSVLRARYTMEATRLHGVPVCMYFATHFYFSSYHVFANLALRWICSSYAAGPRRFALLAVAVAFMSYATAFMETLTISHFPYYDFEDREMAYTVGSAFYGLYFVVSFPTYFALDEPAMTPIDGDSSGLLGVGYSALGCGMAVMCLLDLTRLVATGRGLTLPGELWRFTPRRR